MEIKTYILEVLANEDEANHLEDEKNHHGADVCREQFNAKWEDFLTSLSHAELLATFRVRSQAIRHMWMYGYDSTVRYIEAMF